MTAGDEPNENAKCMDAESGDSGVKTNGRLVARFDIQDKLRNATSEQRQSFLMIMLVILLLIFFIIIVALAVKVNSTSNSLLDRCYTSECLRSAAHIRENMDETVNPCEDFHQYACGGYFARHELNSKVSKVDLMDEMQSTIRQRVRSLIDLVPPTADANNNVTGFMKRFYMSCLDDRSLTHIVKTQFLEEMRNIRGWRIISSTSYNQHSWKFDEPLSTLMSKYAVYPFFRISIVPAIDNRSRFMFKLAPSGFGLGRDFLNYDQVHKPQLWDAYRQYIDTTVNLLKDSAKDPHPPIGNNIINYEKRLLERSKGYTGNLTSDAVLMRLSQVKAMMPNILWSVLIKEQFPNARVDDNLKIYVEDVPYFQSLAIMVSTSTNEVINDYFMWMFVAKYAPHLTQEIRNEHKKFQNALRGSTDDRVEHAEVWEKCIDLTLDYFGYVAAHMFTQNYPESQNLERGRMVVQNLMSISKKNVASVEWLADARAQARDRLDDLESVVGFPPMVDRYELLSKYYSLASVDSSAHLKNVIQQEKLRVSWMNNLISPDHNLQTLARQTYSWTISPMSLRPHYSYGINEQVIPLGMLNAPIFSHTQNKALQYGSFATLVGQQMMKAIDNVGLQYRSSFTVPNSTFNALREKMDCLTEITPQEHHSRGVTNKFIDVAVSDIAGLKVAYQALLQDNQDVQKIPGLESSIEQLFFIAYAQTMCENQSERRIANYNATCDAAPQRLRLLRSLQQSEEFAGAFSCHSSSKMVHSKQCSVW